MIPSYALATDTTNGQKRKSKKHGKQSKALAVDAAKREQSKVRKATTQSAVKSTHKKSKRTKKSRVNYSGFFFNS